MSMLERGPGRRLVAAAVRERRRPDWVRDRPGAWALAVATVCLGAFMGQLDASVVTVAYADVGRELHASPAAVQWISLAYLLVLVAGLVPAGRLSDAVGRKACYLWGFAVFTVASLAAGFAPTLGWLVAARAVQGLGAALLQANSVALVTTSAPVGRRRAALGAQAAAQAVGLAVGPTVGGLVVSSFGWRWVFGLSVPVGIVAVAAGVLLLPRSRDLVRGAAVAPAGPLLLAASTAGLLLALSAASDGAPVALVAGLAGGAVVTGAWFVRHQRSSPGRLLDLGLLRRPAVGRGLVVALLAYLVLFGPLVLVPQALVGRRAAEIGWVLSALPLGFGLAAATVERMLPGRLAATRARLLLGGVIVCAATAAIVAAPAAVDVLVPALLVLGAGLGVLTPSTNAAVMAALPVEVAGAGGALVSTARGLGTALGVALVTLGLRHGGLGGGPRTAATALACCAVLLVAVGCGSLQSGRAQPATRTGRPRR